MSTNDAGLTDEVIVELSPAEPDPPPAEDDPADCDVCAGGHLDPP